MCATIYSIRSALRTRIVYGDRVTNLLKSISVGARNFINRKTTISSGRAAQRIYMLVIATTYDAVLIWCVGI